MTTVELALLVQEMRETQQSYFRARREGRPGTQEFDASRRLERRVDQAVSECLDPQPKLFT